jgi:malic enzyme
MNQNSIGRIGHMVEKVVIIGGGAAGINVLELLLRGCKDPGKIPFGSQTFFLHTMK